jgi:uncharacterized protein (DUF1800 family)
MKRVACAVSLAVAACLAACGGGKDDPVAGELQAAQVKGTALGSKRIPRDPAMATFSARGEEFVSTPCAREGNRCVFSGAQNVAYGARDSYTVKTFSDGVDCNNATFGDPIVGVLKQCFLAVAVALTTTGSSPPSGADPLPTQSPAPSPSPAVDLTAKLGSQEAARFLVQATYGPNWNEINRLAGMGYGAWLTEQFAAAPMDSHWDYYHRMGPIGCNPCKSNNINTVMESFWLQAVRGSDQLRQRFVFALSEIFVISTINTSIRTVPSAHVGYLDMLARNAFGNYRTLLEQVATSPAMGMYLSHMKNEKEDPATGRLPDENFAREVMQLFSIGLWELNEDGSRKKDANGNDIPTYTQADIMGMAKVFTGWGWGNGNWENGFTGANPNDTYEPAYNQPMIPYPAFYSTSEKRILRGVVIPANTTAQQSLKIALDTLFNHPNVGPFIGSQLIKRFVTSNPSPDYVKRVTQAFNDNGQGTRGDMKAVIRAVLLDPEARDPAKLSDPRWGKVREPAIRYANFLRAFNMKSQTGEYRILHVEDTLSSLGQNPLRAPSVFNWFRPDYAPPGDIMKQGLTAPEFQITHETTITGYANFMVEEVERKNTWWRDNVYAGWPMSDYLFGDYSAEVALAGNPDALVDRLNLLLVAGQMTAATRKAIVEAVKATPVDASGGTRRVAFATYLIMMSPEFIVQK